MNTAEKKAPHINMLDVKSSQIHSIGHDSETNTLAIRFYKGWGENKIPGSLYYYSGFTTDEFEAFKSAESLGKHFGEHIKPCADKYPFQRVDESLAVTD